MAVSQKCIALHGIALHFIEDRDRGRGRGIEIVVCVYVCLYVGFVVPGGVCMYAYPYILLLGT